MLKDAGASSVIVGHSERRQLHGERDSDVAAKAQAAWRAGLSAIICVGETEAERDAGNANGICSGQLDASVPDGATPQNTTIAYEPVWAIGTGRAATAANAQAVHALIRSIIAQQDVQIAQGLRIIYGGSVSAANARELSAEPDIDGALVGGASLIADEFIAICAQFNVRNCA